MKKTFSHLATIIIFLNICGCTNVSPWERGELAKPQMSMQPWSVTAQIHKETVRRDTETSKGGISAAAGGGCGCE